MKKVIISSLLFLLICCSPQPEPVGVQIGSIKQTAKKTETFQTVKEYFPCSVGKKWTYQIQVSETDPVTRRVIIWPLNKERQISVLQLGRCPPKKSQVDGRKIILSVKEQIGPKKYLIEVQRDDINYYEFHTKIEWGFLQDADICVLESIYFTPSMPGCVSATVNRGAWGLEDGYADRIIFFSARPGISTGLHNDDQGRLHFQGISNNKLHLRRVYNDYKNSEYADETHFHRAFVEDFYYEKNKGLTAMVQTMDKQVLMRWTLVD